MRRHVDAGLAGYCVLAPPQTCHRLLLCVELESGLAVEGVGTSASDRLFVTGEGEHGKLFCVSRLLFTASYKDSNLQGREWEH